MYVRAIRRTGDHVRLSVFLCATAVLVAGWRCCYRIHSAVSGGVFRADLYAQNPRYWGVKKWGILQDGVRYDGDTRARPFQRIQQGGHRLSDHREAGYLRPDNEDAIAQKDMGPEINDGFRTEQREEW